MKQVLLPRMGDMLFISVLVAGLLIGQRMLNTDGDLGRHLTLGRYIIDSEAVPTRDILSYTRAGESRPPYEWLAQVAFAAADRLMGLDGVVLLTAGVIAAAVFVMQADAVRRGAGLLFSVIFAVWAAAASSLHWLTRPHVFSFLFLAIWLALLDRLRREGRGWRWQLPLVMLVWANFHGGFVFGFIAWSAYLLGALIPHPHSPGASGSVVKIAIAGAASLVASFVTPGFGANWGAVLRNSNAFIRSTTAETLPVSLAERANWPFFALLLIAGFLVVRARRRLVTAHGLLLLMFAGLAVAVTRNIPLFCIAAVPILALWATAEGDRSTAFHRLQGRLATVDMRGTGHIWSIAALVLVIALVTWRNANAPGGHFWFDPRRFPVAAADWASENSLQRQTFNDLNWGGYLLYRMWPERQVFIDSQSDFYGESFIREYASIYDASGDWSRLLEHYGVSSAILPPTAPLASRLAGDPNWQIAFQDSTAAVFIRREP